jgi:hypothetical protein
MVSRDGEEHLEVATKVIPGSGNWQCQRARAHLFDHPWIPAFEGMTAEGTLVCTRGVESETIQMDTV